MRKLITTATLTALALGGVAAASAAEPASTVIRSGDLNTFDTRATGHVDFLRNGLHVYTEGATSTDKAAGYFATSMALAVAGEPSMTKTWVGATPPGKQLVIDFNADGVTDGILVGEPDFYSNRWWANNAANTFIGANPAAPGPADGYGHSAPLSDWRTSYPNAVVTAYGFSLGSGVKGDGVIERMQLGTTIFEFTNEAVAQDGDDGADGATGPQGPAGATGTQGPAAPAAPAATTAPVVVGSGGSGAQGAQDVTGKVTGKVKPRKVKLVFASAKLASGAVQGKSLVWKVKVDGALAGRVVQRAGERDVWIRPFGTGKHVVRVTNNAGKKQSFKLTVK